jgi:D-cysteine desulfhydrase family pyridoxal phosphate-dependent enzyme
MPSKVHLIQAPTPLHRLDRLSADLDVDLWIKRDDLTGLAMGGNKGRKLEYLVADAIHQKATAVVTCGALQSNFIRQLGAAAQLFNIRAAAAVMSLPYEDQPADKVGRLKDQSGNTLLNNILGVDVRVLPDGDWDELYRHQEALAREYEAAGEKVYRIPIGGSSALGALAFVDAGHEIQQQIQDVDWIVTASSSGSTQTGLTTAYKHLATRVLGISSDPEPEMVDDFAMLSAKLVDLIPHLPVLAAQDFHFSTDFVGPGYGIPSCDGMSAIETLARREGIFLDPIYSAKAFAALLSMVKAKEIGGRIVFWHTGGLPTLFAL